MTPGGILWSVDGDIDALSVVIRRWLAANGRLASPKFIVGESYGGFRAPLLAKKLASAQGIGISGLVLISPVLDFRNFAPGPSDPFSFLTRLPSFAAAYREKKGPVSRADLADVEQYATGEYLQDWLRGPRDAAAVARMEQRVAELTGLDPRVSHRFGGQIGEWDFLHEFERAQGKMLAFYDASIDAYDPFPTSSRSEFLDPVLPGFDAPFSSAIMTLYQQKLGWKIEDRYELLNEAVGKAWNWGKGLSPPNAIEDLRQMLALDPNFRVLGQPRPHRRADALFCERSRTRPNPGLRAARPPYLDRASRRPHALQPRRHQKSATRRGATADPAAVRMLPSPLAGKVSLRSNDG